VAILDKIAADAQERNLSIEEYLCVINHAHGEFKKMIQNPKELITRAVNITCTCGFEQPAKEARWLSQHKDGCPYLLLFHSNN